jgi:phospholipid-binding lipoprotein MlaA
MKRLSVLFFLAVLLVMGCAHGRSADLAAGPLQTPVEQPEITAAVQSKLSLASDSGQGRLEISRDLVIQLLSTDQADEGRAGGDTETTAPGEDEGEETTTIADPLETFNRAMFTFNDRLYFWLLKPVAEGYKKIVPEPPRVSVNNFFTNLGFPARFINFLLQADFSGVAAEIGRFAVNTLWGIGGLMDPASSEQLDLPKKDPDFGQTLGMYGVGHGFYFVWPFFGPSSARDTTQLVGDYFLYPVYYLKPWYATTGVRAYEEVNDTSLKIGDYESLTGAAIDPYIALRDAYVQYREKKVEAARGKAEPPRPGGVRVGKSGYRYFSIRKELVIQESRHENQKS